MQEREDLVQGVVAELLQVAGISTFTKDSPISLLLPPLFLFFFLSWPTFSYNQVENENFATFKPLQQRFINSTEPDILLVGQIGTKENIQKRTYLFYGFVYIEFIFFPIVCKYLLMKLFHTSFLLSIF